MAVSLALLGESHVRGAHREGMVEGYGAAAQADVNCFQFDQSAIGRATLAQVAWLKDSLTARMQVAEAYGS